MEVNTKVRVVTEENVYVGKIIGVKGKEDEIVLVNTESKIVESNIFEDDITVIDEMDLILEYFDNKLSKPIFSIDASHFKIYGKSYQVNLYPNMDNTFLLTTYDLNNQKEISTNVKEVSSAKEIIQYIEKWTSI